MQLAAAAAFVAAASVPPACALLPSSLLLLLVPARQICMRSIWMFRSLDSSRESGKVGG